MRESLNFNHVVTENDQKSVRDLIDGSHSNRVCGGGGIILCFAIPLAFLENSCCTPAMPHGII